MKFEETKLPKDKLVEDAFTHAYAHFGPSLVDQATQQIEEQQEELLFQLDQLKASGRMTEEAYTKNKTQLETQIKAQLKQLPQIIESQKGALFSQTVLVPVLELQQHSEKSSPALLAAALLLGCAPDPIDYQKIDAKFGGAVSGLVAEVLHIEAHKGAVNDNLAAASSDAKRLVLAVTSSGLDQRPAQQKQLPPGFPFPALNEEKLFDKVKLLWGNDKKLDTRLVDVFNRVATAEASPYRLEKNATTGAPELVKSAQPKALPAPKRKGPVFKGDDDF